jgi:hypothetical protein
MKSHLADLGLRIGERFLYEYDLGDRWCHDIRVEAILPVEPARRYPMCIGGARSAPPDGCGGPWAFVELEADPERRIGEALGDRYEELEELCRWLQVDRFDRRAATRRSWLRSAASRTSTS